MQYRDRTGKQTEADTKQDRFLRRLYSRKSGRAVVRVLAARPVTGSCRAFMNSRLSRIMIKRFIRKNHIDMTEYMPCRYRSYNAFFMRQIAPGKREISPDPDALISPCDGKATVYPIDETTRFTIKNTSYTVASLLRSEELAREFSGGVCIVLRLTVDNYHRYVYAASGHKEKQQCIRGVFHTVNPIANDYVPVYKENCREYCLIESERFGRMIQMEVGAMMVGRIVNYEGDACDCERGREKGRFEFGGSTIVLLLAAGAVSVCPDLIQNTRDGCETLVKLGETLGVATKTPCEQSPIML